MKELPFEYVGKTLMNLVLVYEKDPKYKSLDVHVRRLRSKLGPEFEAIIGTVCNVGYRFNTNRDAALQDERS